LDEVTKEITKLTPQDRAKPVALAVKVHPKVIALAHELAAYLDDSSVDHAVSEAILDAGKQAAFKRWREAKTAPAIDKHPVKQAKGAA
jgi:hypothetical protein